MSSANPLRLPRRLLIGAPAVIVAAVTMRATPAAAATTEAKPAKTYECAADLLQEA